MTDRKKNESLQMFLKIHLNYKGAFCVSKVSISNKHVVTGIPKCKKINPAWKC